MFVNVSYLKVIWCCTELTAGFNWADRAEVVMFVNVSYLELICKLPCRHASRLYNDMSKKVTICLLLPNGKNLHLRWIINAKKKILFPEAFSVDIDNITIMIIYQVFSQLSSEFCSTLHQQHYFEESNNDLLKLV